MLNDPLGGVQGLGASAAMSQDGRTAVVGAPTATISGHANQGRVLVYTRTGTVWTEQATLERAGGGVGEQFGFDVAIVGDGQTIAVGSPRDSTGGLERGSVTIFTRTGSSWAEGVTIRRTGVLANTEHFGYALAMTPDASRIAIGVPGAATALIRPGMVTVVDRPAGGWTTPPAQQSITAPVPVDAARFGQAVAISSDGSTFIAGGPALTSNRGMAAVFTHVGASWSGTAITPAGLPATSFFGDAIAMSGDGRSAVIAAWDQDIGAANGTVYAYDGLPSSTVPVQVISRTGGVTPEYFGRELAMDDAGRMFASSSWLADVGGVSWQGLVETLARPQAIGAWSDQATVVSPGLSGAARLGSSVSLSGSGGVMVAGASNAAVGGVTGSGAVVFTEILQALGVSVSGPGTVTGDGIGIACGVTCQTDVVQGDSVALTASPNTGAEFTGWGGACSGTSPTCVVTPLAAASVTAGFSLPSTGASGRTPATTVSTLRQKVTIHGRAVTTTGPVTVTSLHITQRAAPSAKKVKRRSATCRTAGKGTKRAFTCRVRLLPGRWTLTTEGRRGGAVISRAVKVVRIR